jgi:fluoride exporter
MQKILLLALAGAFGTLARYWLSGAVYHYLSRDFPWGTWVVNILGCFLFGLVWVLADERGIIPGHLRTIVLIGFMGAFTTFSTYVFESGAMGQGGQWFGMGLNLIGQNVIGFAALYLGYASGRLL